MPFIKSYWVTELGVWDEYANGFASKVEESYERYLCVEIKNETVVFYRTPQGEMKFPLRLLRKLMKVSEGRFIISVAMTNIRPSCYVKWEALREILEKGGVKCT